MVENAGNNLKYYLKNAMEDIVVEKVSATLAVYTDDVCKCDRCFYDICALALNSLKPRYTTTNVGEVYTRVAQLDIAEVSQVSVEVARAIERVRQRPSH